MVEWLWDGRQLQQSDHLSTLRVPSRNTRYHCFRSIIISHCCVANECTFTRSVLALAARDHLHRPQSLVLWTELGVGWSVEVILLYCETKVQSMEASVDDFTPAFTGEQGQQLTSGDKVEKNCKEERRADQGRANEIIWSKVLEEGKNV